MSNPFNNVKVAVVGDAMLDRYIYGSVDRISPEAPVPVVKVKRRSTMLGGSGNVAANLVALGATPILLARLGKDENGAGFAELAAKQGINTDHLVQNDVPTTSKTRIIAHTQQVVRFDEEETTPLCEKGLEIARKHLIEVRKQADIVIVSDYDKGLICNETLAIIKELWADGTVLVDPKPRRKIDYSGVSGMTPNLKEAIALLQEDKVANTDAEVEALAKRLIKEFSLEHILLTRSEAGMTLVERDGTVHHHPTKAREVFDVSGAGDTVMATFAAALAAKMEIDDALHIANVAGGIVVGKLGTATVSWNEIKENL